LCQDAPELLDDLQRQIAALKAMDRQLHASHESADPCSSPLHRDISPTYETTSHFGNLQLLAEGGLGVVYRATEDQLHREVVLKFIHRRSAQSDQHRATFRREAEITSRLDHPGIVPVYGIGEDDDGRIFYVMRYVQGQTLDEAIAQLQEAEKEDSSTADLRLRNVLSRFVTICKTIAYAHTRGIIHRDIKPANIMLGRYGETLMVDWGLATAVGREERFRDGDERTLMPSDGSHQQDSDTGAGTPAYMSPEAFSQAALTPATDIYSLGATLYKLLTGKPPFEGASLPQMRERVLRGAFEPPSHAKPRISRALESICSKAMATETTDRYATALDFAADIENYLADLPVDAYAEPLPRKAARWARRHRNAAQAILAGVSALAVVTVCFAVWLGYLARSEHEARLSADAARQQSLQMTAKFAARTIAGQIDLRWRLLENAASDSRLVNNLRPSPDTPDETATRDAAQSWLNQTYIELQNDHSVDFNTLFLLDAKGTQIARAPMSSSIGKSFAFRDYFHGLGRDLLPDAQEGVEPIRDVNLSATYTSSTSGTLKVAFTVPIIAGNTAQQEVVGVLGMSVELGEFGILESDLQTGQLVVLIDSRPDSIDSEPRRGLILQHPSLDQNKSSAEKRRIDAASLDHIDSPDGHSLLRNFNDPYAPGAWIACFDRVMVEGRRMPIADTGWIVLVQEHTAE
jgi:serine/threonine protein kinase